MRINTNLSIGSLGEDIACKYLSSLGFKIIERNFRQRYSEIDIVAKEKDTTVFVEVKTRRGTSFGLGEEAITHRKLAALVRSVNYYKLKHPKLPQSIRIDVVSVYLNSDNKVKEINLYKNITL